MTAPQAKGAGAATDALLLPWEPPPCGLGPSAEVALVARCLAEAGRELPPALLQVATGHAFRASATKEGDVAARLAALAAFVPERDPWAALDRAAGTRVSALELEPATLFGLAQEELAAGRALVLRGVPGARGAGLVLGARTAPGRQLAVHAAQGVDPAGATQWLALDALGPRADVLRVQVAGDLPSGPRALLELLDDTLGWALVQEGAGPQAGGLEVGSAALAALAAQLRPARGERALRDELDLLLGTALDDLRRGAASVPAGLEVAAAALGRAGLDTPALQAVARTWRERVVPGVRAAIRLACPSRWAGKATAAVALAEAKGLHYAADALRQCGRDLAAATPALEAARTEVQSLQVRLRGP